MLRIDSHLLGLPLLVLITLCVPPALAGSWKHDADHGGHEYKYEEKGGKVKYEYTDGDCKYKYKAGPKGYKKSKKCKARKTSSSPPPWAPAHGRRGAHEHRNAHRGDSHGYPEPETTSEDYTVISQDVGILAGTCHREVIGQILGGVAGGVLGSRVGRGDGKTATTIAGAVIGVLVGGHIGRSMDEEDEQCTGQVLERAADRQAVAWSNPDTGTDYRVTPVNTFRDGERYCREYVTEARADGGIRRTRSTACRNTEGTWQSARFADRS